MCHKNIYHFENGLRKVAPYFFTHKTHAKERWVGRTLTDVFTSEFGEKRDLVFSSIKKGLIYVISNYKTKLEVLELKGLMNLENRKIEKHDIIFSKVHVHEPNVPMGLPISNKKISIQNKTSIEIVSINDEVLVVNKPSGIPTHPCGSFRYNSLTEIIKHDLELKNVWPCHRLDRATSGLLVLGLSRESCIKYTAFLNDKKFGSTKYYYARVKGEFPAKEIKVTCPVFQINTVGGYLMKNIEECPVECTTVFKRLIYNKHLDSSIVLCKPLTGKMHQIRIHLRNLGYPIANDYFYNPSKEGKDYEIHVLKNNIELELYRRIYEQYPCIKDMIGTDLHYSCENLPVHVNINEVTNFKNDNTLQLEVHKLKQKREESLQKSRNLANNKCEVCEKFLFQSDDFMDEKSIWLQASKLEIMSENGSLCFEAAKPDWCDIEHIKEDVVSG